jgi:putative redox protein
MIVPHLSLVKTSNTQTYYTVSEVRQFTIDADEPISNLGTDLAPTPFDLLNSSLASCTAIFLRKYAFKNNIDIGRIDIKIKIKKDEIGNFIFDRTISFENEIQVADKILLLEAIKYTPVTKIITMSQTIQTKIT